MSKKELNIAASITPTAEAPFISKAAKEVNKEKLRSLMNEESKLVRGVFKNFDCPGGSATISVKKYPGIKDGGIPEFKKTMIDGFTYDIPLYVARFLNGFDATAGAGNPGQPAEQNIGTCSYPVHGFKSVNGELKPGIEGYVDGNATVVPQVGVVKRVNRYGFMSVEFAGKVA